MRTKQRWCESHLVADGLISFNTLSSTIIWDFSNNVQLNTAVLEKYVQTDHQLICIRYHPEPAISNLMLWDQGEGVGIAGLVEIVWIMKFEIEFKSFHVSSIGITAIQVNKLDFS